MAKVEIQTKEPIGERMARVEESVSNMGRDLCAHIDKQDQFELRIEGKIDGFISSADKKYASKTVEKIVYSGAGAVLLAVLYYILNHVGIK